MQPEICKPSHEAQQTSSVQKVPPKSDGLQKIQLTLGRRFYFQWFIWKQIYSPKCVSLRTKPTKQVRSKSTSQSWRPSKNAADAGPPVLFSRVYLKMNMQPELCKPSHEAYQTSSFKQYLPNLTVFKNSSRCCWTTGCIFNDLSKNEYAARIM